ncbi:MULTISPECIES: hypothetical protein [Lactiplantibacillus]|jgi:capsular polysaccharide biosynthesis protein|uniref:hypothetical protein n=1 Tax=Lactiplantibacillus TaxID=2767842 RepID=UPI001BAC49D3|nr:MULTISPECIES: hypothetical protein [Lactiplantibacillus]MBS0939923.1 hypothetical protein [Lactiplantibacillus plantarum]MCA5599159.1 hypothetical protein [Lactiplantibacillus argentoratensis]MDN7020665.1 hypothetical protein [Lactiplantibacillus plantarum]
MHSIYEIQKEFIVRFVKHYLVSIILFGVLCGVLGVFASLEIRGIQYKSTSTLIQNDNNYTVVKSYSQLTSSKNFTSLIKAQIDKSKWKNKSYRNDYKLSLSPAGTTSPFFTISVISKNSEYSEFLASLAAKTFTSEVDKYFSNASVSIVTDSTNARLNGGISSFVKIGSIGLVAGLLIGFLYAIYHLLYVGKVRDRDYIHDVYQLRLLGSLKSK